MYMGPRLLQATPDGDFRFVNNNTVDEPYAIVFHDWASGDIAFNDIGRHGLQDRSGYQRLLATQRLLRKLQVDKFWTYTCCVDWSNKRDTSDTFRHLKCWFKEAVVCVVVFADVKETEPLERWIRKVRAEVNSSSSRHDMEHGLTARKSGRRLGRFSIPRPINVTSEHAVMHAVFAQIGKHSWFTCGWSLPALLNARAVSFYSGTETLLCTTKDKHTRTLMAYLIGIPDSVIEPRLRSPSTFSVPERLSWGPDLTFDPAENKSYLKMSLFDSYMDTNYGEGDVRALQRLFQSMMAPKIHMSGLRLLVTATHGLLQETYSPDKTPPYAILSHTWGDDEVSFQDLVIGDARSRLGYRKISKSCELALKEGSDYLWVDTCCINKSSSSELQEAICSMYAWYSSARRCFVFLEDYGVEGQQSSDHSSWLEDSELSHCKWFKRGWTLQELIAPANVDFYYDTSAETGLPDRPWHYIGSKRNLLSQIAAITSIDVQVLKGADPNTRSIAERMLWAAGRKTTRIEDRAYSLMGLFDCYLPMLYGEGERAFIRLQEEILKRSEDFTLFAWKEPAPSESSALRQRGLLASSPDEFAHLLPRPGTTLTATSLQHYHPFNLTSFDPLMFSGRGISLVIPLARCLNGLPVTSLVNGIGLFFGLIGVVRAPKTSEVELLVCILLERYDKAKAVVRMDPRTVYTFPGRYESSFHTMSTYTVPFGNHPKTLDLPRPPAMSQHAPTLSGEVDLTEWPLWYQQCKNLAAHEGSQSETARPRHTSPCLFAVSASRTACRLPPFSFDAFVLLVELKDHSISVKVASGVVSVFCFLADCAISHEIRPISTSTKEDDLTQPRPTTEAVKTSQAATGGHASLRATLPL